MYKGEETTLLAGSITSIANGLNDVVFLPTVAMKIMNNLIVKKKILKN